MGQSGVAIGELSRRTGCNIETIRYYERIGLLPIPARRGRYRLFGDEDIRRLRFVRRARELGFTLKEVSTLLGLGAGACAEVHGMAATHLADVRTRIADLQAMERALADAVQQCEPGEKAVCPLVGTLSRPAAVT
ncbi:MerR family transcriptional regulator [Pseudoroseomonas ludipueritiae]|uniref:MerR family transcriptional regulator n=1 Tax=Pseudoroseomonas ludipueritiae TaxID=198093 RepID=A0ABR7R2Z7_9PROT|nr:MerR family transcriptional regulator [Pseudoroseomonas ludipueritiae]MBC9175995.1 MerR family transcriptional regulator [Pseudoroseomonas ludipueritiae]